MKRRYLLPFILYSQSYLIIWCKWPFFFSSSQVYKEFNYSYFIYFFYIIMLRYLSKVKIYTSFLPFLPFHRNLAFSTQALNTTKSHIENCYGCNSILQSIDKTKYGYIEETVLQSTVSQNKANLQKFYSDKIQNEDAKTY